MKFKTAGVSNQNGDNIIDRDSSGASSGGISNEPAFPNNNVAAPIGQGDSTTWAGLAEVTPPDSPSSASQYYDIGDDMGLGDASASLTLPEQAYAKPTDQNRPNALGPGMSSRG